MTTFQDDGDFIWYVIDWWLHKSDLKQVVFIPVSTLYFHSWWYLVRGWLYRDIIFSFLAIFGEGWLYRDIIFSFLAIFGEGVIISWHRIFTPDNIWWGGDYIVTLYFHSWQYLMRVWLYRDIIFSFLAIFGEGWLYHDTVFSLLIIFGEGLIISWHIFTPEDIWWGGDYIVTLHYHFA